MPEILLIGTLAIMMGFIMLGIGLSLISQGISPFNFNETYRGYSASEYYKNPLYTLNSKYWHYRPKGSVIVSKKQWADIEKSMGIKLDEYREAGKAIGFRRALVEIQDMVKEEEAKINPTSPYAILDVKSTATVEEMTDRYHHLLKIYDTRNFVDLDKAFIQLAAIRTDQIKKAWKQVTFGLNGLTNGFTK